MLGKKIRGTLKIHYPYANKYGDIIYKYPKIVLVDSENRVYVKRINRFIPVAKPEMIGDEYVGEDKI